MPYLIRNPETSFEIVYPLKLGSNTIGRSLDNTIALGDHEKSVSRLHAEIILADGAAKVIDHNSLNSTYVNEVKVIQQELADGDLVCCGDVTFRFVQDLRVKEAEPVVDRSIVRRYSPEPPQTVLKDLLRSKSSTIGSVMKLRQEDSFQRTVDKLKILLEVSKQLSGANGFDRLLEKILEVLFQIMDIDRAVILLLNEATETLEPQIGKSRDGIPPDCQFYSKRIADFVFHHGEAVLTDDALSDERFDHSDSILQQSIHASICVPLKPRSSVIGVLYVDNLSLASLYSQEDLEFLTALANQAAIAIEDAKLYQKMQQEAVLRSKLERFFPNVISQRIKEGETLDIIETEVTALFSDITRFTEMSATMKPREVIEVLNEYFKVMVEEIVFPFEGTLEKYIGDALLAVWGTPYQRSDDAQRAVWAAIHMQWAVRHLNERFLQERNLEIQVHIGLNTGHAAAGNIGSDKLFQYATIGNTTNVASRICTVAQAGEVLIAQSTLDKLEGTTFPMEKLSPVMVKGKEHPLQLYRILWEQVDPIPSGTLNFEQNK